MDDDKHINVKDWINLSSVMIGAVLTIMALIWQVPTEGIITASYLLMVSFIFFVNSVSTNSKANFEKKTWKHHRSKVKTMDVICRVYFWNRLYLRNICFCDTGIRIFD